MRDQAADSEVGLVTVSSEMIDRLLVPHCQAFLFVK